MTKPLTAEQQYLRIKHKVQYTVAELRRIQLIVDAYDVQLALLRDAMLVEQRAHRQAEAAAKVEIADVAAEYETRYRAYTKHVSRSVV